MEFRKAKIEDVNVLYEMEEEYFHSPWNKEQFVYEISENEFSRVLVLVDNDKVIGYMVYWILFEQAQINKICVSKEYRKQGLGSMFMDRAIKDIMDSGCDVISLEVRISNDSAVGLYKKYGFDVVLVKKAYYSDGEDAYYMMKGV